jgi:hypothetical protein
MANYRTIPARHNGQIGQIPVISRYQARSHPSSGVDEMQGPWPLAEPSSNIRERYNDDNSRTN